MAITSSAKKAYRASLTKRVFNVRRKKGMENAVSEVERLVAENKAVDALVLIPKAYKAIDKAAKGHTINKGTADRKKSRLMSLVNKSIK